jgi:hypothetical protein
MLSTDTHADAWLLAHTEHHERSDPSPSPALARRRDRPGAATFAAWWLFLGLDPNNNYTVPQCAALVLLLIAIGVDAAWFSSGIERAAVIVSAGLGISAGCFTSWMDDDTGLFLVGWIMLTPPAFLGAAAWC